VGETKDLGILNELWGKTGIEGETRNCGSEQRIIGKIRSVGQKRIMGKMRSVGKQGIVGKMVSAPYPVVAAPGKWLGTL
jgi:hypothetical protein